MLDTEKPIPESLIITAEVLDQATSVEKNGREVMAIEHKKHPIYGVQFHPESFATQSRTRMIKNFLQLIT